MLKNSQMKDEYEFACDHILKSKTEGFEFKAGFQIERR